MNKWTEFVKAYAKKHKMSYPEAMKKAGPEYRKKYGAGVLGGAKKKKKSCGGSSKSGSKVSHRKPTKRKLKL